MIKIDIANYLRKDNNEEIEYRKNKDIKFIMEPIINNNGVKQVTEEDYAFFSNNNIYISKHNRYAKMIPHNHSFVEINYMYSGSCIQYINNNKIILKKGQLLLMDKDTVHSIDPLGEDDILINILIKDDSINTVLLNQMVKSQSLIFDFLTKASIEDSDHNHYLILSSENNDYIQELLHNMIQEFFNPDKYSSQLLKLTLPMLFIELSRQLEKQTINQVKKEQSEIMKILNYIDENYRNISLEDLANNFGYNKNYISNKLKLNTNFSFSELLERKKLNMAIYYMREDNYSMEQIAHLIGYETPSAFFKLFKKHYQITPFQYKKQMKL